MAITIESGIDIGPGITMGGTGGGTTSTVVLAQATTQYWDVWSDGFNWAVFGIKIA